MRTYGDTPSVSALARRSTSPAGARGRSFFCSPTPRGGAVPKGLRGLQRSAILSVFVILAAAPLAACAGFEPLYAMPNVTPALRSVDIVTGQERAGFLIREQLNDELARDFNVPARYRLNLTIAESRIPRGIRVDNIAAETELDLRVGYDLVENGTGQVLLRGQTVATVFYAATDAPYAGIAAQQDAQERAASQAAVQIRLDLSRQFARASRPAPR